MLLKLLMAKNMPKASQKHAYSGHFKMSAFCPIPLLRVLSPLPLRVLSPPPFPPPPFILTQYLKCKISDCVESADKVMQI